MRTGNGLEAAFVGRRAIILCVNLCPTPRQRNLRSLLQVLGFHTVYVTWDRTKGEPAPDVQDGEVLATVHLAAPTESTRLLFRIPRYLRAVATILRCEMRTGKISPVIVATHFSHLPLVVIFRRALWIYDTAEYYAFSLSRYFGFLGSVIRPILIYAEGLAVKRMYAVLAVDSKDQWFEKQLVRFNAAVRVVPNVPARGDDPPAELITRYGHSDAGRRVIAYVGGIVEQKGLEVALEAVAALRSVAPDVLLLLIKSGQQGSEERMQEMIRSRGLSEYVKLEGPLPYPQMLARIWNAEIGVALYQRNSWYERVGALNARKIFTYMQAGLAVVAPEFGEIARVVHETDCGVLVDTEDPWRVAEALSSLLADATTRVRLQANARRAFEQRYNWESISAELAPWLAERCERTILRKRL